MPDWGKQPRGGFDPHAGQVVLTAGPASADAKGALILVHGRGATAQSMVSLSSELGVPDLAILAPQAAGNTWYPKSFLVPIEANQPFLDSALRRLASLVADLTGRGAAPEQIALLGFSQGACLVCEFIARDPRRYGAAIALTGGLIGSQVAPPQDAGSLEGTPVFLGTSDPDPHVPFERVRQTAAVLSSMGANVDLRRYPGMPHTINQDELEAARALLRRLGSVQTETRQKAAPRDAAESKRFDL